MKNLSIKVRLWGNFALFVLIYVIILILAYYSFIRISEYINPSKVGLMAQTDHLRQALREVEQFTSDAAQTKEKDLIAEAEKSRRKLLLAINGLRKFPEIDRTELDVIQKDFDTYYDNAVNAAKLIIEKGDTFDDEILKHAAEVNRVLPGLRDKVDNLLARHYEEFTNLLSSSVDTATRLFVQMLVIIAIIALISPFIFSSMIRSITKPVERLVYATEELAAGNLDVQAEVMGKDEIAALAVSFNRMARALKEKTEALERTTKELSQSLDVREQMQRKIEETNAELKLANLKLVEADKLKSDFLASMSHELRTPLNAIINFTDQILEDWRQLQDDAQWAAEANDMLNRVLKSSRHLLSLINDLLDLAKIESGNVTLDIGEVDIREIVADGIASVSSLAKAKGITLLSTAPDDLPMFHIDERRILQVMINLLANAIKFTEKGSVTVTVERNTDYADGALIKVIDTGIGIPEKYLDVIFDRFRQVDSGDNRKHAGTGLGLNLVKDIVHLHNGHVKAESREGEGSTFTVYLPYKKVEN